MIPTSGELRAREMPVLSLHHVTVTLDAAQVDPPGGEEPRVDIEAALVPVGSCA
jgi:hypothetical protein